LRDRQVRLWPDNDEAGRKQAEKAVRALVGVAASVHVVDIPDLPEKGDIADWKASGGNRDQLVQVVAQARQVNSVRSSDSYTQYVSDVSALLAKDLPPLREVIPGLLIEGLTVFGGRSKMGKSILVGNLAVAVATGGIALGRYRIDQADALLIALEDGERRLQRRLKRWLEGCRATPSLEFATKWSRVHEGGLDLIEAWLKDHPRAGLVVIDHLELFRAPTDGRRRAFSEDYDATRPLTELATQYSVPILLVHHLNQREAVEDPMQLLSGTEGLPAGVDTAWILQRKRNAPGAELHVYGRDLDGQELALEFDKELLTWSEVDAVDRLSDEQRDTIEVVARLGGCTPKQLAEELGIPDGTARKRLFDYRESGLLEQPSKRGKYLIAGNEGNEGNLPPGDSPERYEGYPRYLDVEVAHCSTCGADAMRELPAGGWTCDSCGGFE
jgi:AAA domain